MARMERRLYFDADRSRLFEHYEPFAGRIKERVYDFGWMTCKWAARCWCETEGVEFIDNSIAQRPLELHRLLLAARKAGSEKCENIAAFTMRDDVTELERQRSQWWMLANVEIPKEVTWAMDF